MLLLAMAALYVWTSTGSMPEIVASHFNGAGAANGYMPRDFYRYFMLFFVTLFPALVTLAPTFTYRNPKARLNLPNREYWLAPERREQSIAYLTNFSYRTGYGLVALLVYMHWVVMKANEHQPAGLPAVWFISGLVMFVAYILWQVIAMALHFRKVPE